MFGKGRNERSLYSMARTQHTVCLQVMYFNLIHGFNLHKPIRGGMALGDNKQLADSHCGRELAPTTTNQEAKPKINKYKNLYTGHC